MSREGERESQNQAQTLLPFMTQTWRSRGIISAVHYSEFLSPDHIQGKANLTSAISHKKDLVKKKKKKERLGRYVFLFFPFPFFVYFI